MSIDAQAIAQPAAEPAQPAIPVTETIRIIPASPPANPTADLLASVLGPLAQATAEATARKAVADAVAPHAQALADLQGQVSTALAQLAAQPGVQQAVDQATAAIKADLATFQADVLAHRGDIYSKIGLEATAVVNDKRSYYLFAAVLALLAIASLVLLWSYVYQGNQRAGDLLKPVGGAFLVLIPAGANALARALNTGKVGVGK